MLLHEERRKLSSWERNSTSVSYSSSSMSFHSRWFGRRRKPSLQIMFVRDFLTSYLDTCVVLATSLQPCLHIWFYTHDDCQIHMKPITVHLITNFHRRINISAQVDSEVLRHLVCLSNNESQTKPNLRDRHFNYRHRPHLQLSVGSSQPIQSRATI